MKQRARILIAVGVLVVIDGLVVGIEFLRRGSSDAGVPGSIPIDVDGQTRARFVPDDLTELEQVSFVDDEEGKTQEGWLLRDVLALYMQVDDLEPDTVIIVSSSSREKSAEVTWSEVANLDNMVMFDLAGRGTLKLVSKLEGLAVRDECIQDVDRIEIR
ncbi:MAG: hypothetical protein JXC32_02875 [Anaerolineae bacterium]|nr:hypothetical protein [Anaerolineae bacterium]